MFSKKYKFFTIEQDGESKGMPLYVILNRRTGVLLGDITWYPGWKQYVFGSLAASDWSSDCLANIIEFLNELNKENAEC